MSKENRQTLEDIRKELQIALKKNQMNEYLEDVYNVDVTCSLSKEYRGASICIAYGGPNIYIDTMTHRLELYWGSDTEYLWLEDDIINEVNDIIESWFL